MIPPRVVHVVLSLGPGGTERLVIEICKRLPAVESAVCCLDEAGAWADELQSRSIDVVALKRQPGFHPSLGYRIAAVARRHRASVLHCHHYSPFVYGQIAALVRPAMRVVFTEHGRLTDAGPSRRRRIVNPVLGRLTPDIYAVSAALRLHMLAEGFPADRVSVIHNGIDPGSVPTAIDREQARRALEIPSDAFVVGTVARFDPVKDLATLVDAFLDLRRALPRAMLVLIGDGAERAALEQRVRAAGAERAVHFTGYRGDVRALLPALDVYANSSVTEGISLTILEAMAAALPVVATRVGGNPEVVIDGHTGALVPSRGRAAMATALRGLAAMNHGRAGLGAAARRRVTQYFTIDRMVDDYHRIYRGVEAS
jgi:glycosyltransferase involved in cell wall biosynthesis